MGEQPEVMADTLERSTKMPALVEDEAADQPGEEEESSFQKEEQIIRSTKKRSPEKRNDDLPLTPVEELPLQKVEEERSGEAVVHEEYGAMASPEVPKANLP